MVSIVSGRSWYDSTHLIIKYGIMVSTCCPGPTTAAAGRALHLGNQAADTLATSCG